MVCTAVVVAFPLLVSEPASASTYSRTRSPMVSPCMDCSRASARLTLLSARSASAFAVSLFLVTSCWTSFIESMYSSYFVFISSGVGIAEVSPSMEFFTIASITCDFAIRPPVPSLVIHCSFTIPENCVTAFDRMT